MTVHGVIVAAIIRKFRAVLAEINKVVDDAKAEEQRMIAAFRAERAKLKEALVDKIAGL
jgi:hypothetical protein